MRPFHAITALALTALALFAAAGGLPSAASAGGTVPIDAGNFYFCSSSFLGGVCDTTVTAGDTVVWSVSSGTHTVTECDETFSTCPPPGGFDSGALSQDQQFSRTFDTPGVFEYHCSFHPQQMRGWVTVLAQATPTPSPAATVTPAAGPGSPTPSLTTTAAPASPRPSPSAAAVPPTGGRPAGSDGVSWATFLLAGMLLASGAGVLGAGLLRRRVL